MASASTSVNDADILDTIPEDRPSNEWMPRNISLQRWWDDMALRSPSSRSDSSGGRSTVGINSVRQPDSTAAAPTRQRRPCPKVAVAILVVVLAVVVAVGIFFIVDSSRTQSSEPTGVDMDNPPESDIPKPSDEPNQTPQDEVEIDILLEQTSGDALMDKNSPQAMARKWLLEEDPAQVSIRVDGEERVLQRYALSVLYFALDGGNWTTGDFLTGASECDWTGVTCNDDGMDELLDLSALGLKGSIPPEMAELSFLEKIVLSENEISDEIPSRLWSLPFLHVLNLSKNQLSSTISPFLWDLPFLEYLYLNSNNLTGTLPDIPSTMPALKHVWLYENSLSGRLTSSLSNLVNLETLVVYDNDFNETLDLQWSLPNLYYVDLSWNHFSGRLPNDLNAATSLQFFYLNNNTLTGTLNEKLGDLTHLEELWLQSNGLTGEIPTTFGQLKNLSTLLLYDNSLHGSVPESLCNLTRSGNLTVFETDCQKENRNGTASVSCTCCTACH
jgi:Leucine-rich repeat (LRR) protein